MMVFSVVPSTVLAETAPEETPAVQENPTEAVQDNTNTNEAEDPATEDSVTEDDATEATTDSSNTDNDAVAQTDTDENKVTISGITIQTPVIQFEGANAAVAEALTKDIKIDESDPAIQSLREALGISKWLAEKPAQNPMNLISAQQTCMKQMNRLKPRS